MKRAVLLIGLLGLTGCAVAGSPAVIASSAEQGTTGRYSLTGSNELRPVRISDDGIHTYIIWAPEQALPAVFAISATGKEEMVDGYMRNDVFTIDRVHPQLVFRIDKQLARAKRIGQ